MFKKNLKGQVWIETVIYTLIGLAIIGILLGIIRPAIEEKKDEIIIAQTVEMLNSINSKIEEIRYVSGNSRILEVFINKGNLVVNSIGESIEFSLESKSQYSEPGTVINLGNIEILTVEQPEGYIVNLKIQLSGVNLTWQGKDERKSFSPAATAYILNIKSVGIVGDKMNIDFS